MYSIKGKRESMEDESTIVTFKAANNVDVMLYAVWDGHGGPETAKFVSKSLPPIVAKYLSQVKNLDSRQEVREALRAAHDQVNNEMPKTMQEVGCTSCMVLYVPSLNRIFCTNVGDSRAVLYLGTRDGSKPVHVMPLSIDHKPDEPYEAKRLKALGATVHTQNNEKDTPRVWFANTGLSMARAFGDLAGVPYITHVPDFCSVRLHRGECGLVVIGCDGLWDVMTNTEVWSQVYKLVSSSEKQKRVTDIDIAKTLVRGAYAKGSTDNISVVVCDVVYQ